VVEYWAAEMLFTSLQYSSPPLLHSIGSLFPFVNTIAFR